MSTGNFTDAFKRDTVAQITLRGYPVNEVAGWLRVSKHALSAWKCKFAQNGMLSPAAFEWRTMTRHEGV